MPMYEKYIKVTITITLILIILCIIVIINFFTNDNVKRDTIEKSAIIRTQGEEMYKKENLTEQQKIQDAQIISVIQVDTQKETQELELRNDKLVNKQINKVQEDTKTVSVSTNKSTTVKTTNAKNSTSTTTKQMGANNIQENTEKNNNSSIYKGYSSIGKIEIPKTRLNIPILSNVTTKGMEIAPCLLYSTGELNKSGKNLIVGHNYRNGKIFSNNKNLQIGDKIYVTTLDGIRMEYTIYDKFIATPEETSYLKGSSNNKPEIILSTCTDDENFRTIILAKAQ